MPVIAIKLCLCFIWIGATVWAMRTGVAASIREARHRRGRKRAQAAFAALLLAIMMPSALVSGVMTICSLP